MNSFIKTVLYTICVIVILFSGLVYVYGLDSMINKVTTAFLGSKESPEKIEFFHIQIGKEGETIEVGKMYQLEISIVDENYEGTVIVFSESDEKALFSERIKENVFSFGVEDKGSIIFDDGVVFSQTGTHDIHAYDLSDEIDSISGKIEVLVEPQSKIKINSNLDSEETSKNVTEVVQNTLIESRK